MKICIPSSNRPDKCSSAFLCNAIVFVPEGQKSEYEKYLKNEIIEVPGEFYGITKTRNFILRYFLNEDIVFIDDDVKEAGYFKQGLRINLRENRFSSDWLKMFEQCFQITKEFGFSIWGAENGGSKFSNHAFNQIDLKGSINGTILGIVSNSFSFDEKFIVKEDFDLILRAYRKEGGFLKFNNFYWRTKHWDNAGGCVDYRTNKIEEQCIEMLKKRHGNRIKIGTNKNRYHTTLKF